MVQVVRCQKQEHLRRLPSRYWQVGGGRFHENCRWKRRTCERRVHRVIPIRAANPIKAGAVRDVQYFTQALRLSLCTERR